MSQQNRIKQRRSWLLLGWMTSERSCPCKQYACSALVTGTICSKSGDCSLVTAVDNEAYTMRFTSSLDGEVNEWVVEIGGRKHRIIGLHSLPLNFKPIFLE
ncbi:hypothetical protein J6590_021677 [Homalodisca vitripennis]|nr:hypothetical protein J6590_021677 [Homalodisca vitripennis]